MSNQQGRGPWNNIPYWIKYITNKLTNSGRKLVLKCSKQPVIVALLIVVTFLLWTRFLLSEDIETPEVPVDIVEPSADVVELCKLRKNGDGDNNALQLDAKEAVKNSDDIEGNSYYFAQRGCTLLIVVYQEASEFNSEKDMLISIIQDGLNLDYREEVIFEFCMYRNQEEGSEVCKELYRSLQRES